MVVYAVMTQKKISPTHTKEKVDSIFLDYSKAEEYIGEEICYREDISPDDFWIEEFEVADM